MNEKQYFLTIIKCAICKKEGILHNRQDIEAQRTLQNSNKSGFKYGAIGAGEWVIACDECIDKNRIMLDRHRMEKENFLKGE